MKKNENGYRFLLHNTQIVPSESSYKRGNKFECCKSCEEEFLLFVLHSIKMRPFTSPPNYNLSKLVLQNAS
ncbi:hypothetical protein EUGRSUZ_D02546 [Eucalyptus grandis]|uniref:Uncharacterized protein n=2 Tax=Eucalyptus grandis TaxID=71139 RepID=A0A059CKC1_EUCGR|nr:hypothetical protein EUGRSUZ_D02546 [Eucalyptus grandis]